MLRLNKNLCSCAWSKHTQQNNMPRRDTTGRGGVGWGTEKSGIPEFRKGPGIPLEAGCNKGATGGQFVEWWLHLLYSVYLDPRQGLCNIERFFGRQQTERLPIGNSVFSNTEFRIFPGPLRG